MDVVRIPASSIERQFWLTEQWRPGNAAYQIPSRFEVTGDLSLAALQSAVDDAVATHEALRTGFALEGDQLMQVIAPQARCPITVHEAAAWDEATLIAALDEETRRPFELTRPPLLRVSVFQRGPARAVVSLVMHHIVTDLASKGLLSELLSERYRAHLEAADGPLQPLPAAPNQYRGYCERMQGYLDSPAAQRARAHYQASLRPAQAPLSLPTDRPRPPVPDLRGGRVRFALGPERSAALRAHCEAWQSQPFLVLLAAYGALLMRYAEQDELQIGVPLSNRRTAEDRDTLGCFVNMLPMRLTLSDAMPFAELLGQVRTAMLLNHRHQALPLSDLIDQLNPTRFSDRNTLFQTGFTFEPPMSLTLAGAEVSSDKVHAGGSQLDLFMTLWPQGDDLHGQLEYSTALWETASAERMVDSFLTLLDGLLAGADPALSAARTVVSLPLVSAAMAAELAAFNATEVAYPGPILMHERMSAQALRTPDAAAVRMGGRVLSYRELDHAANGLSLQLIERGVRPGDAVALFLERSLELVVAIYGVLKAGAAYMPLDPEHPEARLLAVLADGQPKLVLCRPGQLPPSAVQAQTACVEVQVDRIAPAEQPPMVDVGDDHPAYVIFTSGSTGRPKGVVNGHRGIHNRIVWMQEAFELTADDVVLQKTPFGFDVSVWEFLWPLTVGAVLEVAPPGVHRDPEGLSALIARAGVTTIHFVPSMLQLFLEHPSGRDRRATASLRRVLCSGEALPADLVARFYALLGCPLHNLYGPTEAAVDVTHYVCERERPRDPVPIGKAIANTQIHILDPRGQASPIGVAGELHIGGVQVAHGYIGRPDLTAERFIVDPFRSGGRLYRSGDRARYLADGNIEYLGRLDHQIKLRGLRIELGEIESVLGQHADVAQAVVAPQTFASGEVSLVAYVVLGRVQADGPGFADALRQHAAESLPAYMVPPHVMVMERFPLTGSGKVDRKLLPMPQVGAGEPTAPEGEVEQALHALWCELLRMPAVGTRDNFFELGGTSLLSARMLERLRADFDPGLPMVVVFEHPTIESLAKRLRTGMQAAAPGAPPAVDPAIARAQQRGARRRGAARRR